MPGVLPPVTDCGCITASNITPSGGACCPIVGVEDPNVAGITPTDPTVWTSYLQLADLVNGPPMQTWTWNPNLLLWQ